VHGDLHLQQVYWAASGRFAILDWQTVRAAPGASDVSRLIASSTEPETQAAEECALVERYHAALVANGVEGYSLDACWEHYRRSLLQSVLIHTVGAAQLDLTQFQGRSAAQGRAWTDRFFGWVDAALVRHGVLEWMRSVQ
jgi:aminoglycoside phosphotransferase (APT) family kinase protein